MLLRFFRAQLAKSIQSSWKDYQVAQWALKTANRKRTASKNWLKRRHCVLSVQWWRLFWRQYDCSLLGMCWINQNKFRNATYLFINYAMACKKCQQMTGLAKFANNLAHKAYIWDVLSVNAKAVQWSQLRLLMKAVFLRISIVVSIKFKWKMLKCHAKSGKKQSQILRLKILISL